MTSKHDISLFQKVENNIVEQEDFSRPSISYGKDVIRRLFQNPVAVISLVIIILIVIMSAIGPHLTKFTYFDQDYTQMNVGPNEGHYFGTDDLGRDLFARAWQGGRVSLFIGFAAAFMDFIIGVTYGSFAGYTGGRVDTIMMRITEILYSIPYMLMVILFSVILGSGIPSLILAMTVTGWIPMARLVRGQTLQLKELEYVQAAKSFGAPTKWILSKHMLPNMMGPIIVSLTLTVPRAIFAEATLSFLGLGVSPPNTSWGQMANDGLEQLIVGNYLNLFVPSILICLTMLCFNLLGDGLRDALDPRLRK
ncbi:MAG: ABC transporter permease [Lachnospirales bacterium]